MSGISLLEMELVNKSCSLGHPNQLTYTKIGCEAHPNQSLSCPFSAFFVVTTKGVSSGHYKYHTIGFTSILPGSHMPPAPSPKASRAPV